MAEQTTPLAGTIDAFASARGHDADAGWAYAVAWRLMMRDVDPIQVAEGLGEALALVQQTGESPEDLFGPPDEHADTLYDRWGADGRLVLADGVAAWRDAIVTGLLLGGVMSTMFVTLLAVRDGLTTPTVLRSIGASMALGVAASLAHAAWSRRHHVGRCRSVSQLPDQDPWSIELTRILRSRYSLSAARVRDIVDDARAHAVESRQSLESEFGTPVEYAARFAPDRARRSRFTAAAYGLLAALSTIQLVDGSWIYLLLVIGFGWAALKEYRSLRGQSGR